MDDTAYFDAIRDGDADTLRRLVAERPELLEARTAPDWAREPQVECTGLHVAIHAEQPEAARVLIEAGIDLDARTREGRSALHDAIEFGQDEICALLLEHGAELDVCSAAILGRLERVRELLDRDPALANDRSSSLSPLGWAAFGNRVETATELIERGARMDDHELFCAAAVGHVEVGRLLLERGADPNEIGAESGATALHAAAGMRYTCDSRPFIEMLLEHGADIDARTRDGRTALQIAERGARAQARGEAGGHPREFEAVAALLRARGAS